MLFFRSERDIGRGETPESQIEAPAFALFMFVSAIALVAFHLFVGHTPYTVALAISMLVFGTTILRVDFGVYVLVIAMMLSPEIEMGSGLSGDRELNVRYDDVLIIIIFFGVIVKMAFEGRLSLWQPSPVNLGIMLYYGVCLYSTMLAYRANLGAWDKRTAFFVLMKMLQFYMVFVMVGHAIRNTPDVRRQLTLYFLVGMVVCAYCIYTVGSTPRVSAPFEKGGTEPNTLGGYLMLIMTVAVALSTQAKKRRWALLLLGMAGFAFVPFLYTLSRASYLSLLSSLTVVGVVGRKPLVIGGLLIGLLLAVFLSPEAVKDRVNYTFQRGTGEDVVIAGRSTGLQVDKSTHERIYVWRKVRYILRIQPWFGGGVSWESVLDSQYARVILETGLVGLAAFVFLQWRIMRTAYETYRWSLYWVGRGLGLGVLAGTVGLIVHSLGTISFLIVRIMGPYWFLIALCVVARNEAIAYHARKRLEAQAPKPVQASGPAPETAEDLPPSAAPTAAVARAAVRERIRGPLYTTRRTDEARGGESAPA